MDFIREFWEFIKIRKKYWLLPIMVMLLLVGTIVIIGEGSSLSPFIYAIF